VTAHDFAELAQTVSCGARNSDLTIAVAESLTSGRLLSELGRGEAASQWLRGGVVAYATEVKQQLLRVSDGPVVSARCAEEMAAGVARLLGADVAVSTTGVGGPDPQEGRAPGTVYIGWWSQGLSGSELHEFEGSPADVVEDTVAAALAVLSQTLEARP
jgi:nicotinamide-nucleotide amidase